VPGAHPVADAFAVAYLREELEDFRWQARRDAEEIARLSQSRSMLAEEVALIHRHPFAIVRRRLHVRFLRLLSAASRLFGRRATTRFALSALKRDRIDATRVLSAADADVPAVPDYDRWLAEFDTPPPRDWAAAVSGRGVPLIFLVDAGASDGASPAAIAASLTQLAGAGWQAFVRCRGGDGLALRPGAGPRPLPAGEVPDFGNRPEAVVVVLDMAAEPRPHAVWMLTEAFARDADAAAAYGDEDLVGDSGMAHEPWFKPVYSPLLARHGRLFGRLFAFRLSAIDATSLAAAWRDGETGLAEAVAARLADRPALRARRIQHVLFHNRLPLPPPKPVAPPALPAHLPLVSIIIPTRDHWPLLKQCLESIYATDWPADRLEILVVDNGSVDRDCLEGLREAAASGRIIVHRDDGPFNYSRLNNEAVQRSRGELLVLLNNDTTATTPGWLKVLAAYALLPGAGAVGPKLLYADGTVQHGGVLTALHGAAAHAHVGLPRDAGGYAGLATMTREVSAVTGACLCVTRSAFQAVGGLRETLRVSFNDAVLCLDLEARGYVNYFVHQPLFYHYESKTRGLDDTWPKRELALREAIQAILLHRRAAREDRYYSPNLSLDRPYGLSFVPRRRAWWRLPVSGRPRHVLMLSSVHAVGYGVATALQQHARALVEAGCRVTVGGPIGQRDRIYPGCGRIAVVNARQAARWAITNDVDVIIAHTPPFYSVSRWVGNAIAIIGYDYGEPPPELFDDMSERRETLLEKDLCLARCDRVFAISESVRDEGRVPVDGIIPFGNSHLGRWDAGQEALRARVRAAHGWDEGTFVVLNVARFYQAERRYKGIDRYAEALRALRRGGGPAGKKFVFVLCGQAEAEDALAVRRSGLEPWINVPDEALVGLYAAADAYVSLARWEGHNLGIGQAQAMGLPVIASDIPAHRALGVTVAGSPEEAAAWIRNVAGRPTPRVPRLRDWQDSCAQLSAAIDDAVAVLATDRE